MLKRILTAAAAGLAVSAPAADALDLQPIGRAQLSGAEITAYDARHARAYVTDAGANALHVVDLRDPAAPSLLRTIDLEPYGGGPNSVAVSPAFGGLIAVAVEAGEKTEPGSVVLFDTDGDRRGRPVPAGALPDMLTFTPDGRTLLVANEGEPDDAYAVDPEGSVTVVDFRRGLGNPRVRTAGLGDVPLQGDVRLFGPGATAAQDLEPEYIATDGARAWVTLQENNAIGVLDVAAARFDVVRGLGHKDHGPARNALDPSDRDGVAGNLRAFPNVLGLYQPDAIAAYRAGGRTLLVTANEGDARDYDGFAEEARAGSLPLDAAAFPPAVRSNAALGRLTVTTTRGDTDGDGDYDRLHPFGARSMSVLDAEGAILHDTGDELERTTLERDPLAFNADNVLTGGPDSRSDNKGPEPEAVTVGTVDGTPHAFLGAERSGGLFAYDLGAVPGEARLAGYASTRPADLGPEGVVFVRPQDTPAGVPLLLVTNEVSGTLAVFRVR